MEKSTLIAGGFANSFEVFELIYDATNVSKSSLIHKTSKACAPNPAFIMTHENRLYAVHENLDSGDVSYYKINGNNLQHIVSHNSCGAGACHLDINPKTSSMFIPNYYSGHFVVLKLKDWVPAGSLYIESYESGSLVDKERQEGSHPHGAFLYKNYIYISDLGADKIWHYKQTDSVHGTVTPCDPSFTDTPPGSGPRHMAFCGNLAFALMELTNQILVYRINEENGQLDLLNTYDHLKGIYEGKNYGAEIMVHPNNRFLYVTNRVNGCIIVYEICDMAQGVLKRVQNIESGGTWPRHFTIHSSGKFLICADQFKDELTLFTLDENTGYLSKLQTISCPNKPSCLSFVS